MQISDELMRRFVAGECDSEQEHLVMEYLHDHPSYLEEFCKENPVLMDDRYRQPLKDEKSEQLLDGVYAAIDQHRRLKFKRLIWVSGLIAATVLLFVFLFDNSKGVPDSIGAGSVTVARVTKTNATDQIQIWILPDSSVVEAMPGASITYLPRFTSPKKEVFLSGEANFTAHHESNSSFVVICGGVATTALGTRFKVRGDADVVTVVLYEGKVVVRSKGRNENDNYCYLNPGMSTVFYKSSHRFITTSNFVKKQTAHQYSKVAESRTGRQQAAAVISLENLSMQDALDQLALAYNVEIQYSPVDIQHMNIIASIPKTQPIEHVLGNLARANGLELIKSKDSVFLIRKK